MINDKKTSKDIISHALESKACRELVAVILSGLNKAYSGNDPQAIARCQALNNFGAELRFTLSKASPDNYLKLKNEESIYEYRRNARNQ